MKTIRNNILETGIIETLCNISHYQEDQEVYAKCSAYIPVPELDSYVSKDTISEFVSNINKKKLLFLTPELPLFEKLSTIDNPPEIIISLPNGIDRETSERIESNMPDGINVRFISDSDIPTDFKNGNGAILAFGFADGDRALILNYNYRMMERYRDFYGRRILISCAKNVSSSRPIGWAPINTYAFFNEVI